MARTEKILYLLNAVLLSLPYIIYQHVVLVVALEEILNNLCKFTSLAHLLPLNSYCTGLEGDSPEDSGLRFREHITPFVLLSIMIQFLNNFTTFNLLYKLILWFILTKRDGHVLAKVKHMMYTSSTFKASGLTSCNPAQLWPSLITLKKGYLFASDSPIKVKTDEEPAEERGVYRFKINELDINIKTNKLARDETLWHVESITKNRDGTEVLLCEMTSEQVNLMIRTLSKWAESGMNQIGVIEKVSKLPGLTVLYAMQLSEILDHIKAGKDVSPVKGDNKSFAFVA